MNAEDTDHLLNKAETPAFRKYQELFNDSDDDDSFSEIECDLCAKTFSNVKAYEQHLNGKKHHQMLVKKKLMKKARVKNDGEEGENMDPECVDDLHCEVCEKTFSGYKPYGAHMKGSIHAKNLKQQKLKETLKDRPEILAKNSDGVESDDEDFLQKPYARCSVCEKLFYDPISYKKHMDGSSHKKKMFHQRTLDSLKSEFENDPQIEDEEFFMKCDVCSKNFSGPVPYNIHLKSGVHKNQVKRAQAMEKLKDFFLKDSATGKMVCKECKKVFTDPFAFKLHLDNNSHGKQKAKDEVLKFVEANPEIVAMKSIENISSDDDNEEKVGYEKGSYFLVCKLCHNSFSGLESAKDHVKSKKHLKNQDEKKKMKLLKNKMTEKKKDRAVVDDMADISKREPMTSKIAKYLPDGHPADGDDFELI